MEPKDNMYGGYIDVANYDPLTTVLPSSGNGLWSQIQSAGNTFNSSSFGPLTDPLEEKITILEKQITDLVLNGKLMRLKILSLEGKFDKEEVANLRKMIMSEDEAAKTLADSIIENA